MPQMYRKYYDPEWGACRIDGLPLEGRNKEDLS